jgi:GNAT superfamily N-acetyltransferase
MIRPLQIEDIEKAYVLGLEKHEESDSSDLILSKRKFVSLCLKAVRIPEKLCLVAINDSELVGMLFADITSPQWSDDLIAEEYIFVVGKKYRGGLAAAKLIKKYIDWAKGFGVKKIYISANSGHKTEKLANFYTRLNFRMQGYNFVMEN